MRAAFLFLMATTACSQDYGITSGSKDPDEVTGVESDLPLDTDAADTDVVDTDPTDTADAPSGDTLPPAEKPVYAHTKSTLFEVEPTTGAATAVGPFMNNGKAVEYVVDIAIDSAGRLFAGYGKKDTAGNYAIYRVDPTTADMTLVCAIDTIPTALTFTDAGLLVAAGLGTLVGIDVDSPGCNDQSIVYDDPTYSTSGDLVGLPDGLLYWSVAGSGGDKLVAVDPIAHTARLRGSIGFSGLYGLGYDETADRLYGFSSTGQIVEITASSAAARLVVTDPTHKWWGATTNPVVWQP